MFVSIIKAWKTALQVKSFLVKSIISGALLVLCAIVAPIFFQFIQKRDGYILNDYLLNLLPTVDLSYGVFILLYLLIFVAVGYLLSRPQLFLVTLQAYIILTIFRFITIFFIPLDPPSSIIELNDPFVQYFFYQQSVTKDLFFSGHTSLLLLLTLSVQSARLKAILFAGSCLVAIMLLFQHAHYTIDILAAPFFSWLAFALAKRLR
jgi:hypothetical protein